MGSIWTRATFLKKSSAVIQEIGAGGESGIECPGRRKPVEILADTNSHFTENGTGCQENRLPDEAGVIDKKNLDKLRLKLYSTSRFR
jgi:hypothetical protein